MSENIIRAAQRVKSARQKQDQTLAVLQSATPGTNGFATALENHTKAAQLVHDEEKYLATLVIAEMERTS
jgi:hypothetical protein